MQEKEFHGILLLIKITIISPSFPTCDKIDHYILIKLVCLNNLITLLIAIG